MATYELLLRVLPDHESIETAHGRMAAAISEAFGVSREAIPDAQLVGEGALASSDLSRALPGAEEASLLYSVSREPTIPHDARFDDSLQVIFAPDDLNFEEIVESVVVALITRSCAYHLELAPADLLDRDFEQLLSAGKRYAPRVYPVSYFSGWFWEESFRCTLDVGSERLEGIAERIQRTPGGIFIIGSCRPLEVDEASRITSDMTEAVSSAL